jgi:GntR family transcriptional regulator
MDENIPFYKEKISYLKEVGIDFVLNYNSGIPYYRQIIQMVEYNIAIEKLKSGDKLPTIRSFAIQLKVNPNTIAKAYTELEIKGFVKTHVGSGTFIGDKKIDLNEVELKQKIDNLCAEFLNKANALGISKKEIINILKEFKSEE